MRAAIPLLAVVLGVSCAPVAPLLHPTRSVVEVREVVKVVLTDITFDILDFTVWNYSTKPMVIDRDAIVLDTDHGARKRLPGGAAHTYTLEPGAARDVHVRFDFVGLRGTNVKVRFDNAIFIHGHPIDVSPIEIRVL